MKHWKLALVLAFGLMSASAYSAGDISNYAESSGFKVCLSAVKALEAHLVDGSENGSITYVSPANTNDHFFNAVIELPFGDDVTLVDLIVAPSKDGTCSFTFTQTWYTEQSCTDTTKDTTMKNMVYRRELKKFVKYFTSPNAVTYLIPAGTGCIVQQKRIGYQVLGHDS